MSTDPKEIFSQFFETLPLEDRARLRGRYNPNPASRFDDLLVDVRDAINESFEEITNRAKHWVECGPIYFDYIDSDIVWAFAFPHDGRAFIAITVPFVTERVWELSRKVAKVASPDIARELNISIDPDKFAYMLFLSLLFFVVAHELTHHVNGHSMGTKSLQGQAEELDADSQAVVLVLQNLLQGTARPLALSLLNLETLPERVQNNVLYSCFILVVVAYFLETTPTLMTVLKAYTLEHPPQGKRIDNLVNVSRQWCSKCFPELAKWINPDQFGVLSALALKAVFNDDHSEKWTAQNNFLASDAGAVYLRQLDAALHAHLATLAQRASSATVDST